MTTLQQAIVSRGIDERHQLVLLKRRASYAQQLDRPKCFADSPAHTWRGWGMTKRELDTAKRTIKLANDTKAYVSAWCRLNHLKEEA